MKKVLTGLFSMALGLSLVGGLSAEQTSSQEGMTIAVPGELKWSEATSLPPGAQVTVIEGNLAAAEPFTFRIKFPPNYRVPPHTHPVDERVTVISGKLNVGAGPQFDPSSGTPLPAGGVAIVRPDHPMYVWTEDQETIVQLNGVGPWGIEYVNPADDPRKQ